jgi:hypothetical protein
MSDYQLVADKSREYVVLNYGNLVLPEEPVYDEKENLWKVKLRTQYPRLIKNDSPEERFVRTLDIQDLGTLWLGQKNEVVTVVKEKSSSRRDAVENLRIRLKTWEERAEGIIVKCSASHLANTGIATVFLNPIRTVLGVFIQEENYVISFDDLESSRSNYLKWVLLLEDLQLVRKEKTGYVYGNMFTELMRNSNQSEFMKTVLTYVIRERYPVLKEAFGVRQFETLVHMDSCYYRPALEAGRMLYQKPESLFKRYFAQYNPYKPELELRAILLELCNSEALHREDDYYFGNAELFEKMLTNSEDFLRISSPRI